MAEIRHQFDIGSYINADDIEKTLRQIGHIDLADFGITDFSKSAVRKILNAHPLYQKAQQEGFLIDLVLQNNRIINPDHTTHSYEAALIADIIRHKLLTLGKKFTFETVMSHESKIDFLKLARNNRYKNYLYFIATESPLINIERVKQRVQLGGHSVPTSKIESRYYRSLGLLRDAVRETYRTFVFDNSEDQAHLILEVFQGEEVVFHYPEIPKWVDQYLLQ